MLYWNESNPEGSSLRRRHPAVCSVAGRTLWVGSQEVIVRVCLGIVEAGQAHRKGGQTWLARKSTSPVVKNGLYVLKCVLLLLAQEGRPQIGAALERVVA